jgi:hypothetical protein
MVQYQTKPSNFCLHIWEGLGIIIFLFQIFYDNLAHLVAICFVLVAICYVLRFPICYILPIWVCTLHQEKSGNPELDTFTAEITPAFVTTSYIVTTRLGTSHYVRF